MKVDLIGKGSPFVAALKSGTEFRRTQVAQGQRNSNAADILCDSGELLAELVNHCFLSSIAAEEGRPVGGTICICSPDDAPLARALRDPVLVSVKNLVALLTASPQSPLAIHATENGLVIWGFLDATPMFTLKLRVAGAGTIVASEGRNVLAVLQSGEVHIPVSGPVGHIDWVTLVAKALDRANSFPDRLKRAARLLGIVSTMHRQGHGGALVVVPSSTDTWKRYINFSFTCDDSSSTALRQRLLDLEEAETRHQNLELGQAADTPMSLLGRYAQSTAAHRNLVDATLRSIGDLSSIDGAVVMDEELRLFGFGAKLQVESDGFQVLILDALTGTTTTVPNTQLDGTRHQSAARFVHQNRDAMAFVASQDARLTLLAWVADPGQLAAVRSLEHFIWEYP